MKLRNRFTPAVRLTSLGLSILLLASCGKGFGTSTLAMSLSSEVQDGLACSTARANIFEAYYKAYSNTNNPKSLKLASAGNNAFAEKTHPSLKREILEIDELMTSEMNVDADLDENRDPVLNLIRLEMRSEIDPRLVELNRKLDGAVTKANLVAKSLGVTCNEPAPQPEDESTVIPDSSSGALPGATATPSKGTSGLRSPASAARYTMATAYQSCSVAKLPVMTKSVENLQGVTKTTKIDSVGWGRGYTDLALLKKTDYYLQGQTYPAGCLNQNSKPLVYDYGGRPVVKSTSSISLFENSGGGTALGIDCSAFVSSAVGVAGQRYKEGAENKAVYTRFVSRDFINPVKSGWTCYDSVSVNAQASIKPGDIAAVVGHVVMVDTVGSDPFGLSKVTSASGCSSLSVKNFDFSVIQSSPSKNSIGINRYTARDYLPESAKITTMFMAYAKAACQARFDSKARAPNTADFGIIRHKATAKCLAPALTLVGGTCVNECT